MSLQWRQLMQSLDKVRGDVEYIRIRSCMKAAARVSMKQRDLVARVMAASVLNKSRSDDTEVLICGSSASGLMPDNADLDVTIVGSKASVCTLTPHREQVAGLWLSLHVLAFDQPDGLSLADYCRWAYGRPLVQSASLGASARLDKRSASLPIGLIADLYQHDRCRAFALSTNRVHASDIKYGLGGWVDLQILGLALRWYRVHCEDCVDEEWVSVEAAVHQMQEIVWVLRAYALRILGIVLLNRQALSNKAVPWFFAPDALAQRLVSVRLAALTCAGLESSFQVASATL